MNINFEIVKKTANTVITFIKKNPKKAVSIGLGASGGVAAAIGAVNTVKANKRNKEALKIREEALSIYEAHEREAESVLEKLGNLRLDIITSFDSFIDAVEKISGKPRGIIKSINNEQLSMRKIEELKALSNNVRAAIASAGGFTIGSVIGIAVFGIGSFVLGPGALIGGSVFCIKGININKKSIQNKKEAIHLRNEVDKLVIYLQQLSKESEMFYQTTSSVNSLYQEYIQAMEKIVSVKTDWKSYTRDEKLIVKNTSRLVKLLNDMCKLQLILKPKDEDISEKVNEKVIRKITAEAKSVIGSVKPVSDYVLS